MITASTSRRTTALCLLFALTLGVSVCPAARAQEAQPTFDVWPGKVPGETGNIGPEKTTEQKHGDKPIHLVTNVTKPTLTLFRAPKDKDTGAAVVICPGGGYSVLAWDLEGTEVAEWLNSIGVTGIVLKYRVPKRPDQTASAPPLQDAQRAMSLVRAKAGEWGIDPGRIGMLGFSAGGNLTALACTHYDHRTYEPADDADKVSCRPDFGVLVYPAWLVEEGKQQLKPEFPVNDRTPQMFLVHAGDDGITAANSAVMYLALKKAGVPAELHIYATGGHGFGLRPTDKPCSTWPQRCEAWMRSQGLFKAAQPDRVDHAARVPSSEPAAATQPAATTQPAARVRAAEDGTVLLHAKDVTVHGTTVRYEPQPNKNTVGYWTKQDDWVSWDFETAKPGKYHVVILQGCGQGSGGAEVEFHIDGAAAGTRAGATASAASAASTAASAAAGGAEPSVRVPVLKTTVEDTGGFQNFVSRDIGTVELPAGAYTLSVKPLTKPGVAVMDLRSVTLKPVEDKP